jgi:hypothetical protein
MRLAMQKDEDKSTSFERYKFEQELALKRAELDLRQKEIALEPGRERRHKLLDAILLALVAVIGTFIGALLQGRVNSSVEEQKLRSSLIIEAIKTGDPDSAKRNLLFFIESGLLEDPEGKISGILDVSGGSPVLPSASSEGGVIHNTNADLLAFCQRKFGPMFRPVEGRSIYCSDGAEKHEVTRAEVCLDQFRSDSYTMNFGTLSWHCAGPSSSDTK